MTPESVALDIPAEDGTLLRFTVHRDSTGAFFSEAQAEVQRHTEHGLRPVVMYTVKGLLTIEWDAVIPDGDRNVLIGRHWMTVLHDWLILMAESSIDIWRVKA